MSAATFSIGGNLRVVMKVLVVAIGRLAPGAVAILLPLVISKSFPVSYRILVIALPPVTINHEPNRPQWKVTLDVDQQTALPSLFSLLEVAKDCGLQSSARARLAALSPGGQLSMSEKGRL